MTGHPRVTAAADALDTAMLLHDLERRLAELHIIREAIAAAAGVYDCPCGGYLELEEGAALEDYAALNRFIGHHERCGAVYDIEGES